MLWRKLGYPYNIPCNNPPSCSRFYLGMGKFSQLRLIAGDTSGPTHIISNFGSQISGLGSQISDLGSGIPQFLRWHLQMFGPTLSSCQSPSDRWHGDMEPLMMWNWWTAWVTLVSNPFLFAFQLAHHPFECRQPEADAEWPLRAPCTGWPAEPLEPPPHRTPCTPSRPRPLPWDRSKTDRSVTGSWSCCELRTAWCRPPWSPLRRDCSTDPGRTTASSTVPYR